MTSIDEPLAIREGEELDADKLDAWLRNRFPELDGQLTIRQFPGGASNLTYSLQYANRDWVLRRPPFGKKPKSGHDMKREYRIQRDIAAVYPTVPRMVLFEDDPAVMGCDFYIMERVRGVILRKDIDPTLQLDKHTVRQLCLNVLDKLIELHTCDYAAAGLTDIGKPEGYIERQVSGWIQRFQDARTDNAPDFHAVLAWLERGLPPMRATGVVHGDYRFDNCIMDAQDPTRVIAVLDWEMATLGDPLNDLGNNLCLWIEADDPEWMQAIRQQPTHLPGMLTRREVVETYLAKTGYAVDDFNWYYVWGMFRMAVILQQIYYRFHHGQTRDERFGQFIGVIHALEQRCKEFIRKGW